MRSDLTDRFDELNTEIKFQTREMVIEMARSYGEENGLPTGHVLKNMARYMGLPLSMQIEYNLTGWKGYEGIELPRERFIENPIELKRKLLMMDRMDGKIDPETAMAYDAQLVNTLKLYNKLKDTVISETVFSGSKAYKN